MSSLIGQIPIWLHLIIYVVCSAMMGYSGFYKKKDTYLIKWSVVGWVIITAFEILIILSKANIVPSSKLYIFVCIFLLLIVAWVSKLSLHYVEPHNKKKVVFYIISLFLLVVFFTFMFWSCFN